MKFSRSQFVLATGAYATVAPVWRPADAAEFSYKWALDWPSSHPITIRSLQAAQKILTDSNGRLQIRVFADAVLGSSSGALTTARAGAIEVLGVGFGPLEPLARIVGLAFLPFVFAGNKVATDAMDGPFGKAIHNAIARLNLYPVEVGWDGGFRQFTNSVRPLLVPDDMKGLRLRTSLAVTSVATLKALGAAPVPMDMSELYSACQTHIVDGTDLPLSTIESTKMYEVQKYCSISNWAWTGYSTNFNLDAWQKLPANLQEIVQRNVTNAVKLERVDIIKQEATIEAELRAKGLLINTADIAAFKGRVRSAGLYSQWRSQYGTEAFDLLEQAVGKLV